MTDNKEWNLNQTVTSQASLRAATITTWDIGESSTTASGTKLHADQQSWEKAAEQWNLQQPTSSTGTQHQGSNEWSSYPEKMSSVQPPAASTQPHSNDGKSEVASVQSKPRVFQIQSSEDDVQEMPLPTQPPGTSQPAPNINQPAPIKPQTAPTQPAIATAQAAPAKQQPHVTKPQPAVANTQVSPAANQPAVATLQPTTAKSQPAPVKPQATVESDPTKQPPAIVTLQTSESSQRQQPAPFIPQPTSAMQQPAKSSQQQQPAPTVPQPASATQQPAKSSQQQQPAPSMSQPASATQQPAKSSKKQQPAPSVSQPAATTHQPVKSSQQQQPAPSVPQPTATTHQPVKPAPSKPQPVAATPLVDTLQLEPTPQAPTTKDLDIHLQEKRKGIFELGPDLEGWVDKTKALKEEFRRQSDANEMYFVKNAQHVNITLSSEEKIFNVTGLKGFEVINLVRNILNEFHHSEAGPFFFQFGDDKKFKLELLPTAVHPGNGLIKTVGRRKYYSYNDMCAMLKSAGVTSKGLGIMLQKLNTSGLKSALHNDISPMNELHFMLLFEVAKRLVRGPHGFSLSTEPEFDQLPIGVSVGRMISMFCGSCLKYELVFGNNDKFNPFIDNSAVLRKQKVYTLNKLFHDAEIRSQASENPAINKFFQMHNGYVIKTTKGYLEELELAFKGF